MSRRVPGRALRVAAVPLALVLTLVAARSARSFVPIVDTSGNYFHWRIDPVHWEENSGGEESMTGESAEVQAAFDTWEDLVEATVNFTNDGTVGSNSCGSDGVNRICYNDPAGDQGPGVLATTYSSYSGPIVVKMGDSFGRIVEADIAFNNGVDFTTNAGAGAGCFGEVDIRGVVAHEIGHFIGLDHSSSPGATMAPAIGDCDPGAASLSSDDIDGAAFLYPSGIGSPPPVADFTASPTTGPATLAVSFSDLSSGTVATWAWNFGDGGTSALPNPSHNYVAPGTYTVSLTVTGIAGSDGETKTGYINVTPGTSAINSDFSGAPRMGSAPLTVTFSDLTTPSATGWSWDFGAAGTSALQNPTVTFVAPGSYDVSLGVTNGSVTDVELKTGYVDVMAGSGPAVADFSGAPTRGLAPMSVVFTDLSSGAIDTWSWNFGDGIGSTSPAPSHVFSAPGLYTVSLTVSGPGGSSTETKTSYIEVLEPGGGPVADFVADPLQGTAPFRASFADYSTGEIDQRVWNFGEGDVIIEATEFAAMFPEPGYYDIALTVSGAGGSDTLLKENYIVVLNPDGTLPPNPDTTTGIGICSCRVVGAGDNHDSSTAGLLVVGLGLLTSTAGLRRRRRR